MTGLGTIINCAAIIAGGLAGHLIGSVLIFCVGVNLVWGRKIRVANMLPAVLLAIAAAYIPWSF